ERGGPVGEEGEGLGRSREAVQGLQEGPGGLHAGAAGRALRGVTAGVPPKYRLGAGREGLGVDRIQGALARHHVTSPDNLSFNTALARKSLFLTVPRGMFLTPAISSYDSPAKWRRAMSSRKSAGRSWIARLIALPRSTLRSSP